MTHAKKLRIAEFIIFGVLMNMLDNVISVLILGETKFHWQMLIVIFLVVLPFGYVNEIIVDHPNFWKKIWPEVHPVKSAKGGSRQVGIFNGVKEEVREIEQKMDKRG